MALPSNTFSRAPHELLACLVVCMGGGSRGNPAARIRK